MTRDQEIDVMAHRLCMADGAAHPISEYEAEARRRYRAGERVDDMPSSWDIDDIAGFRG